MGEREFEIAMAEEHYSEMEIAKAEEQYSEVVVPVAPHGANEAPPSQTGDASTDPLPEEQYMADEEKKYRATGYFFTFSRSHGGGKQPEDMTREEAFNHVKKCYDEVRLRLF